MANEGKTFGQHVRQELEGLRGPDEKLAVEVPTASAEPYVRFTKHDLFGLALSGGGIRSATFNLGVLQSLDGHRILGQLDYLSTVSGGGYIGGAFSARLQREHARRCVGAGWRGTACTNHGLASCRPRAPAPASGTACLRGAPRDCGAVAAAARQAIPASPIRHMREFSRFLAPRPGIFSTDIWHAAFALVAGLSLALVASTGLLLALTIALRLLVEHACLAAPAVVATALIIELVGDHRESDADRWVRGLVAASPALGLGIIYAVLKRRGVCVAHASPILLLLAAAGLPVRLLTAQRRDPVVVRTIERTAARLLAMTAIVWLLEQSLQLKPGGNLSSNLFVLIPGAASPVAAAALVSLRSWFFGAETGKSPTDRLGELPSMVRRQLPGVLAGVAIFGAFALSAIVAANLEPAFVVHGVEGYVTRLGLAVAALTIGVAAMLLDAPANRIHEFYRSRIARAYVGASLRESEHNRQSVEQEDDDVALRDLPRRPLHLVCCAANDVLGDGVRTLARGARSATLSVHGLTVQDSAAPAETLHLSSALTASAAAFNSLMGSVTMEIGPSVGFVLTALGLRLGLWLPHPARGGVVTIADRPRLFVRELLGRAALPQVDERCGSRSSQANDDRRDFVHLSDGGHFENLALYELIRRHCRYVIVSDASADADRSFDDLANAMRRVRIDFGVEIEIDVEPLRSNEEGFAHQHAVVGTIHYDGKEGLDKGTIIYFKPTITGDEPADLLQYRTHNPTFPHESTVQQFYDEAQWESYRRLGQHAADEVFRFVETFGEEKVEAIEPVFSRARRRWAVLPKNHQERFLELTQRCTDLEQLVQADASVVGELFGELPVGEAKSALLVAMIAQVMEDVWLGLDLEHHSSHPLHRPWLAYMERWSGTDTFRRYFPLVAPLYNDLFVKFVQYRLGVGTLKRHAAFSVAKARAEVVDAPQPNGYFALRRSLDRPGKAGRIPRVSHEMTLQLHPGSKDAEPLQLGVLHAVTSEDGKHIEWRADDLFVPESLLGGGFHSNFLERILELEVDRPGGRTARVTVEAGDPRFAGRAGARQWRVDLIDLYKSVGFTYEGPPAHDEVVLVRAPRPSK